MAGMGPPPKPESQRRRRNVTAGMIRLPAEGREGAVPRWPLGPDIETVAQLQVAREKVARLEEDEADGKRVEARLDRAREKVAVLEHVVAIQARSERALWRELWRTPMAAAWEAIGYNREVAQYVRWKILAENGSLDAAKEARQLADRLGLSSLALQRLRWEIAPDELAAARETRPTSAGTRRGLRVVDGEAV